MENRTDIAPADSISYHNSLNVKDIADLKSISRAPDAILYNGSHDAVSATALDEGNEAPPFTVAEGSDEAEDEDDVADGYVTSSQM